MIPVIQHHRLNIKKQKASYKRKRERRQGLKPDDGKARGSEKPIFDLANARKISKAKYHNKTWLN